MIRTGLVMIAFFIGTANLPGGITHAQEWNGSGNSKGSYGGRVTCRLESNPSEETIRGP